MLIFQKMVERLSDFFYKNRKNNVLLHLNQKAFL